ncbi:Chromosome partition protein Smc [Candidatus Thermoflexus japonica]|uniref:Chromosome partition protein Smc n=1 Tax=Candidatus Thermoflexus japonica TaxID=2035417 RepID=A0A2H5Y692_9CHLR|nr:Chromosome partition protein Smc [Candidatus Thermoflexus japonica]
MAQLAERVGRLEEVVAQQAERIGRLEEAVARLAEAQARTEERVARLEEAMAQLAERVAHLEEAMAQLAERVARLEARMIRMEERLMRRLTAFGARWGLRSERAWREGMRAVLEATGFEVERWVAFDAAGVVFDSPSDVELDVIVRDGKTIIVELRTSVSREALPTMERKVKFYEQQTGRKVDRRILITPWYEPGADAIARRWGWELYGEPEELQIEE